MQRFGERHVVGRLFPFPRRFQIEVRRQAGIVGEQLADGDVVFSVLRKLRQVLGDCVVEANLSQFHELHDGGGGGDHLGQRCEIEDGVQRHGLAFGLEGAAAVGLAVDDLAVVADD